VQIRRLRLTGFKSFVEPTELRIEPGLTGVVGRTAAVNQTCSKRSAG